MERDQEETIVLFRRSRHKEPEGLAAEITAVFPEHSWSGVDSDMTCYAHVGQHGACSIEWYHSTRRATPPEYAPLKRELESLGYNLVVRHRISPQMRAKRRKNASR